MKRIVLLLMVCVLALSSLSALATSTEGFYGYFEHVVNIRAKLGDEKGNVGTIPAYTRVWLKPVTSTYAEVTYEGAQGYVYTGQVLIAPKEEEVTPYILNADGNKVMWKSWTENSGQKAVIKAGTPIVVTGNVGSYYHVFTVGEGEGYIHQRDTKTLYEGVPVSGSVYSLAEVEALEWPLDDAKVKIMLFPQQLYQAYQQINGYYRIRLDNGEFAYVNQLDVQRSNQSAPNAQQEEQPEVQEPEEHGAEVTEEPAQTEQAEDVWTEEPVDEPEQIAPVSNVVYVALVDQMTPFYQSPAASNQITEAVADRASVVVLEEAEGGFYLWPEKGVYVDSQTTEIWNAIERDGTKLIYAELDVPLLQLPDPEAGRLGYTLVGGHAYTADYEMGDYYVVVTPVSLGFAPKSAEGLTDVK